MGVLNFLAKWLSFSNAVNRFSVVTPTHWKLLSEFQSLGDTEIERFLPQVCAVVEEEGRSRQSKEVFNYFSEILASKCSSSSILGLRTICYLKAAEVAESNDALFRNVLGSRGENVVLRYLENRVEQANRGPEDHNRHHREAYNADMRYFLDSLARIGAELRSTAEESRLQQLHSAIAELNQLFIHRLMNGGSGMGLMSSQLISEYISSESTSTIADFSDGSQYTSTDSPHAVQQGSTSHTMRGYEKIASQLPEAARLALHFPLQHCQDSAALRMLRFLPQESEILPSKEKCPFTLTCEVLEDPSSPCGTIALFGGDDNLPLAFFGGPPVNTNKTRYLPASVRSRIAAIRSKFRSLKHRKASSPNLKMRDWKLVPSPPLVKQTIERSHRNGGHVNSLGTTREDSPFVTGSKNEKNGEPLQETPSRLKEGVPVSEGGNHVVSSPQVDPLEAPVTIQPVKGPYSRPKFVRDMLWRDRVAEIRRQSAFGHLPGWGLRTVMVKTGDDSRREMLAMQILTLCQSIFRESHLDIRLRPYQIFPIGYKAGLIEYLHDVRSVDAIKRSALDPQRATLKDYFECQFGPSVSLLHSQAVLMFVKSLVGYSLVTFLLQVKDRHNGNIMIADNGAIVHVDFGFVLGESPGLNINFESAPFKFTLEYLDLLGGRDSAYFRMFEDLFVQGFRALQKRANELAAVVELFDRVKGRSSIAEAMKSRLLFARTDRDIINLISESIDNWRTRQYDWYQERTNQIRM